MFPHCRRAEWATLNPGHRWNLECFHVQEPNSTLPTPNVRVGVRAPRGPVECTWFFQVNHPASP